MYLYIYYSKTKKKLIRFSFIYQHFLFDLYIVLLIINIYLLNIILQHIHSITVCIIYNYIDLLNVIIWIVYKFIRFKYVVHERLW